MSKKKKEFWDFIGDTSRKHWVAEAMILADEYNRKEAEYDSNSFYDDLDEFGEDQNEDFGFSTDFDDEESDLFADDDVWNDDEDSAEDDYLEVVDKANNWRKYRADDATRYSLLLSDYNTEEELDAAIAEQKALTEKSREEKQVFWDFSKNGKDRKAAVNSVVKPSVSSIEDPMWRTKRMNEAVQYGLSIFGFKSEREFETALQKKKAQKKEASAIKQQVPAEVKTAKKAEKKFPVSKYADNIYGFRYNLAVADYLPLPEGIDKEDLEDLSAIEELIDFLCRVDAQFTFDAWKWCYETFWSYCQENRHLIDRITARWAITNDDFIKLLMNELEINEALRKEIFADEAYDIDAVHWIIYDALEQGKGDLAAKFFRDYCKNTYIKEKDIFDTLDDLVRYCTESENARIVYLFVEKILSLTESLTASKLAWHRKEWEQEFCDYGFSLERIEKEIRGECKRPEDWMLDYWKSGYGFDYAKVIADRLDPPAGISKEELEENSYSINDLFTYIVQVDKVFAIKAWKWCYINLLQYDSERYFIRNLLEYWEGIDEDFADILIDEIIVNPEIRISILAEDEEAKKAARYLIYALLRKGKLAAAVEVYDSYRNNPKITEYDLLTTLRMVLHSCKYDASANPMRWFAEKLIPLMDFISIPAAARYKEEWLKEIDEYLSEKESSEEESDYSDLAERIMRHVEQTFVSQIDAETDSTIYRFVGVVFTEGGRVYSYRTYDQTIEIGDLVLVETSNGNKAAEVVSIMDCRRVAAPYPVDKTKFILRKIEKE